MIYVYDTYLPVATGNKRKKFLFPFPSGDCLPGEHKEAQVDWSSFAYIIVETKARSAYASPRYARPRFCLPG